MATYSVKRERGTAERYPEDITRIVALFAMRGDTISRRDAEAAWKRFSDSMAASWMIPYDEDERVLQAIMPHLETDDEEAPNEDAYVP